jgi:hypothetical protein
MVCDVKPEPEHHTELGNCRRHPMNSIASLVVREPEGLTDHEILSGLRAILNKRTPAYIATSRVIEVGPIDRSSSWSRPSAASLEVLQLGSP